MGVFSPSLCIPSREVAASFVKARAVSSDGQERGPTINGGFNGKILYIYIIIEYIIYIFSVSGQASPTLPVVTLANRIGGGFAVLALLRSGHPVLVANAFAPGLFGHLASD